MTSSELSGGDILRVFSYSVVQMLCIILAAFIIGKLLRLDRKLLVAVILVSTFMNAGNFGLSIAHFTFGETALAYASVFFVGMVLLTYTVGAIIASLGTKSFLDSLKELLRIPTIYAIPIALVILYTGVEVPLVINRTTSLMSDASIPLMLILLGLQFHKEINIKEKKALLMATGLRLIGSPMIGFALAGVFSLSGAAYQASIMETAMPTAVATTVLATEYDVEPGFITSAVFLSTIISPLTLTPILAILGA
jgi:predicted permease